MRKLNEDFFSQRKKQVERIEEVFLRVLDGDTKDIDSKELDQAAAFRASLHARDYTDSSARAAVAWLLAKRR